MADWKKSAAKILGVELKTNIATNKDKHSQTTKRTWKNSAKESLKSIGYNFDEKEKSFEQPVTQKTPTVVPQDNLKTGMPSNDFFFQQTETKDSSFAAPFNADTNKQRAEIQKKRLEKSVFHNTSSAFDEKTSAQNIVDQTKAKEDFKVKSEAGWKFGTSEAQEVSGFKTRNAFDENKYSDMQYLGNPMIYWKDAGRALTGTSYENANGENGYKNEGQYFSDKAVNEKVIFAGYVPSGGRQTNFADGIEVMSKDEIDTFNYLYMTDIENGVTNFENASSKAFLDKLMPELRKRRAEKVGEDIKAEAKKNPVGSMALRAMSNIASASAAPKVAAEYIDKIGKSDLTSIDPNKSIFMGEAINSAMTDGFLDGKSDIEKFVYGVGLSVFDNLVRRTVAGGTQFSSIMMAGQSFTASSYKNAVDNVRWDKALTLSLWNTAAEFAGEAVNIKMLDKATEGVKLAFARSDNVKKAAIELLKSINMVGIKEGIEEAVTEVLNIAGDLVVLGDKSKAIEYYDHYISEHGEDKKVQALLHTALALTGQVLQSAASGYLSGIVSGGTGDVKELATSKTYYNAITKDKYSAEIGKKLNTAENVKEIIEKSADSGNDTVKALASEIKDKAENNKGVLDENDEKQMRELSVLATAVERDKVDEAYLEIKNALDSYDEASEIKSAGEVTRFAKDGSEAVTKIENELISRGTSDDDRKAIIETVENLEIKTNMSADQIVNGASNVVRNVVADNKTLSSTETDSLLRSVLEYIDDGDIDSLARSHASIVGQNIGDGNADFKIANATLVNSAEKLRNSLTSINEENMHDSTENAPTDRGVTNAGVESNSALPEAFKLDESGKIRFNQVDVDYSNTELRKGKFRYAMSNAHGQHKLIDADGFICGRFGICRTDSGKYSVVHLQGGLGIGTFDTAAEAKQCAEYMNVNTSFNDAFYGRGLSENSIYIRNTDELKAFIAEMKQILADKPYSEPVVTEIQDGKVPFRTKAGLISYVKSHIGDSVKVTFGNSDPEVRTLKSISNTSLRTEKVDGSVSSLDFNGSTEISYTDTGFNVVFSTGVSATFDFVDTSVVETNKNIVETNKNIVETNKNIVETTETVDKTTETVDDLEKVVSDYVETEMADIEQDLKRAKDGFKNIFAGLRSGFVRTLSDGTYESGTHGKGSGGFVPNENIIRTNSLEEALRAQFKYMLENSDGDISRTIQKHLDSYNKRHSDVVSVNETTETVGETVETVDNSTLKLTDKCELIATKHTASGDDIWVVTLKDRISPEKYKDLNSMVKAVGGYYSRFAKTPEGKAIPGFVFKAEPTAKEIGVFNDFFGQTEDAKPDNSDTNVTGEVLKNQSEDAIIEEKTDEEGTNNVREETIPDTGNDERRGRVAEENSRRKGSNRERVSRKIKEILRKSSIEKDNNSVEGRKTSRIELKETTEEFEDRVRSEGCMYAEFGRSSVGYKNAPKSRWSSGTKESFEILESLGLAVVVYEGNLHTRSYGLSEISSNCVTAGRGDILTIFIPSDLDDAEGRDAAYHEAFHALGLADINTYSERRNKMVDIISEGVNIESETFVKFVSNIGELYSHSDDVVSLDVFSLEVTEEFYAWYIGSVYGKDNKHSADMLAYIESFSNVKGIKPQLDAVFEEIKSDASSSETPAQRIQNDNEDENIIETSKENSNKEGVENVEPKSEILAEESKSDGGGLHAGTETSDAEAGVEESDRSPRSDSREGLSESVGADRSGPDVGNDSEGVYGTDDAADASGEADGASAEIDDGEPETIDTEVKTVEKKRPSNKGNFVITDDIAAEFDNTPPSAKDNIEAIELLLTLESEGRAATAMAITSGNPLVKEKIDIDKEVKRLKTLQRNYLSEVYRYQDAISKNPGLIRQLTTYSENLVKDIALRNKHGEKSAIVIKDKSYEKQNDANKALLDAVKTAPKNGQFVKLGTYKGFDIMFKGDTGGMNYAITLNGANKYAVEYAGSGNNIARFAGALNRLDAELDRVSGKLEVLKKDLEFAKREVAKPFEKEKELTEALEKQKDITYRYEHYNEINSDTDVSSDEVEVSYSVNDDLPSYTIEEYNDYGWARANGLLSAGQNEVYRSKFADAVTGQAKFKKTSKGEYMIPVYDPEAEGVNNVIVFAKGTIDKPIITSIIEIDEFNETDLDRIRRRIYDGERRSVQQKTGKLFRRYFSFDYEFRSNQQRIGFGSIGDSSVYGYGRSSSEKAFGVERKNPESRKRNGNPLSNGFGGRQNGESIFKRSQKVDGRSIYYRERPGIAFERRKYCKTLRDTGNTEQRIIYGHKCEVIPKEHYTDRMSKIAAGNAKDGFDETIFITGGAVIPFSKDAKGDPKTAKGIFVKTNGKKIAIVQYDHSFMPEQINDHEKVHNRYDSDLTQKIKKILLNSLTKREKQAILEKLSRDYNGIIEGNEGKIFEEFVANFLSGMNEYSVPYNDLVKAYWKGDKTFIEHFDATTYSKMTDSGGNEEYLDGLGFGDKDATTIKYSVNGNGNLEEELSTEEFDELMDQFREDQVTKPKLSQLQVWGDRAAWVLHNITRVFPDIPERGERGTFFAEFRKSMIRWKSLPSISATMVEHKLNKMTEGLSPKEFDTFSKLVYYLDLQEEAKLQKERGYPEILLPHGISPEKVDAVIKILRSQATESVEKAISNRQTIWDDLKARYIELNSFIGFDTSEKFKRQNYYHHEVIEHMNKSSTGTGSREIRVKSGRGWLKERQGSTKAISTDFLAVEYKAMLQMQYDIYIAETLGRIKKQYDIKPQLEQQAFKGNKQLLNEIIAKEATDKDGNILLDKNGNPDSETYRQQKWYNQRIMFGFSGLIELAQNDELPTMGGEYSSVISALKGGNLNAPGLYKYVSILAATEIAENANDDEEQMVISSRTVMKYTAQKKAWIKEVLGDAYQTWETIAKSMSDTHSIHQPRRGNYFYTKTVIDEDAFTQAQNEIISALVSGEVKYGNEDVKKIFDQYADTVRLMGAAYEQWVLPKEIVDTMYEIANPKQEHEILQKVRWIVSAWKGWATSLNPLRTVKFGTRNIYGDLDAVVGANPKIILYSKRATQDIYEAMRYKNYSQDFMEWIERGGYTSMIFANEMDSEMQDKLFAHLKEKDDVNILKIPVKVIEKYTQSVETAHNFREAILRYSAYLYFKDSINNNGGTVKDYVASNRYIVKGLVTVEDKAYQLSKDLLGAYDEVGKMGQMLRMYLVPFYSFTETNLKRYYRLFENVIVSEGGIPEKAAKLLLKALMVNMLGLLIAAWNRLVMRDIDDKLPPTARNVPHITLGMIGDEVYAFRQLGSFSELLEWIGFEDYKWASEDLMAPVDKAWGMITPFVKQPIELISGLNFYPSLSQPRAIRDKWQHFFNSLGVDDIYNELSGKPTKGIGEVVKGAFLYNYDYKESAYYEILDIKREFQKKNDNTIYGADKKSNALYYMKQAVRYKDKKAALKYLEEYFNNGGTVRGIKQSFATLNPMFGFTGKETIAKGEEFIASLTEEQKEKLKIAQDFYENDLMLPEIVLVKLGQKGITDDQAKNVLKNYIASKCE